MNSFGRVAVVAVLLVPIAGLAQTDGEGALKKSGCLSCHSVSGDRVGPSFRRIAAKYKGQNGVATMLESELKRPNIKVNGKDVRHAAFKGSDAELKNAVAFILSQ